MSKSRLILSAEETRSRIQKNLKPIITQHKKGNNISLCNVLNIRHLTATLLGVLMMVFVISNFPAAVAGVHHEVAAPAMKRIEEPISRSFSRFERGNMMQATPAPKILTPLENVKMPEVKPQTPSEIINNSLGSSKMKIDNHSLTRYALPSAYYDNLDYSSFQPFMCYTTVTNRSAPAWKVLNSKNAYTDGYGFRRYKLNENQLSVNGKDDYIIALGTYYKKKGSAGSRFLVVTTTGMYTAITGDEKSDAHTDKMKMFSSHGKGKAGLIEWIVDQDSGLLPRSILKSGTVTTGPIKEINGKILYIYKID